MKVEQLPAKNFGEDERDLATIDTIILHSMFNPKSPRPYAAGSCLEILNEYEVSAHYLIDRRGRVYQLVPENHMAWHAGKSRMPRPDNRERVNIFSIGVELAGNYKNGFTNSQYTSLTELAADVATRCPIRNFLGHNDITQGVPENPKTDPWNFDWPRFRLGLSRRLDLSGLRVGL